MVDNAQSSIRGYGGVMQAVRAELTPEKLAGRTVETVVVVIAVIWTAKVTGLYAPAIALLSAHFTQFLVALLLYNLLLYPAVSLVAALLVPLIKAAVNAAYRKR